jgi:hypothetical protein
LLSRWRTGGQTSFDLVREFMQELSTNSASDAWQRAVLLTMDSRVNFAAEPRVKHAATGDAPKASHAFFWAGYMLVDSGAAAEKEEEKPGEPVIKEKPRDKGAEKGAAKGKPKDEAKEGAKDKEADEPKPKSKNAAKEKVKPEPQDDEPQDKPKK